MLCKTDQEKIAKLIASGKNTFEDFQQAIPNISKRELQFTCRSSLNLYGPFYVTQNQNNEWVYGLTGYGRDLLCNLEERERSYATSLESAKYAKYAFFASFISIVLTVLQLFL